MKILGNSLGERCALLGSFHREERNKYMIYILFWYRLSSFSFFSLSLPPPPPFPCFWPFPLTTISIKEPFYARVRAPFSKNDDERPFWRASQYAPALSIHNACELRAEAHGGYASAVQQRRDAKNAAIPLLKSPRSSETTKEISKRKFT